MATNTITILRKRVITNIPMFADDETEPQNEWIKLADYRCVEIVPATTARVYALEHAENYSNQATMNYIDFSFNSPSQKIKPPYDILEGDYVGYRIAGTTYYYRIVKAYITQVFHGCCEIQLTVNITEPRDVQYLLNCGVLKPLRDWDLKHIEEITQ